MRLDHALHPDLSQCALEARRLPAVPGLLVPQFLAPSGINEGFVVTGLGQGDGFGNSGAFSFPGPSFMYPFAGVGPGGAGGPALEMSTGFFSGFSIFGNFGNGNGLGAVSVSLPGSGATGRNGSLMPPAVGPLAFAYGGSFSSGYNTGLNGANGYGMALAPPGSITPHLYETGTGTRGNPGQDNTQATERMIEGQGADRSSNQSNGQNGSRFTTPAERTGGEPASSSRGPGSNASSGRRGGGGS